MGNAILVLHAGSSSLKLSVLEVGGAGVFDARAVGQVEGLGTAPRLKAKGSDGDVLVDQSWSKSEIASHGQALQEIATLLRSRFAGRELLGVGHRVVPTNEELMIARPTRKLLGL